MDVGASEGSFWSPFSFVFEHEATHAGGAGSWGFSFLGATEKHWIAHEAQVIVVGTFKSSPTWLWFDGWHINGVITTDEVLYGGQLPGQIRFEFAVNGRITAYGGLRLTIPRLPCRRVMVSQAN